MLKREPDQKVIQQIIDEVQPPIFRYLDDEIGDKTYLSGNSFSIADVSVTCQFIQMMYSGEAMPQSSYPNVTRFVNNHIRRESFKRLINNDPFMKID